jgi:acyl-CoA reductase-like NAD-dependent aldehyde dehydrogenase
LVSTLAKKTATKTARITREDEAPGRDVGHEGRLYIGGEWIAPTGDVERGLVVAARVRTGTFGVNQPYSMDPAAPFGGVKASGFGHELGREGLDEYLDIKAISVAPAP